LIQEFIDGYDLTQEISPGKKLIEGDVIQLLQDVLEILVYVHENKFIHRDIKPANIMRRKDGKLVLIDFGIVKQINTTIALKSGFTTRTIGIGTAGYMPLEQAMGKPKFSSDIYALGMTAIQALIDLSPRLLPEDDDGEIIWIDQVEISDKLNQFINKMVRCDWKQRYRNAKEALEELNQVFRFGEQQNGKRTAIELLSTDWFEQGNQLLQLKSYEEAIAAYDKAISIKSNDSDAWYNRGLALGKLQRYTEALTSFNQTIAIKPNDNDAWCQRGVALRNLQMYKEAIASYDTAIAIKPNFYLAWNNRGATLGDLQMCTEAIESFDKAIAIKPDYYEAWYNRGVALGELKRYEEALESCEKAINIKPDYQPAINNRNDLLKYLRRLN
jgi:eukaryotic-like serine/threonine-protein kinase